MSLIFPKNRDIEKNKETWKSGGLFPTKKSPALPFQVCARLVFLLGLATAPMSFGVVIIT